MKSNWKRLWMLVSVLVLVGSMAGCGLFGGDDDDTDDTGNGEEEPETVTVYFYNSEGWDEVYAYSDDVEGMGSPGETASEDPDAADWYMIEIERDVLSDPMDIVFHNNDGTEADPAYINHPNQVYTTFDGEVFGSRGGAEDSMSDVFVTVYFYNTEGWDTVNGYAWTDTSTLTSDWPGDETVAADREGWRKIDIQNAVVGEFNVIFNNGEAQTGDTPIDTEDDLYVVFEGAGEVAGTYGSFEDAEAAADQVTFDLWFYNDQGWDSVYADATNSNDETILDNVQATQDGGTKWYSVEVPADLENVDVDITFSDGDTNTGDTLTITNDSDLYVTADADTTYGGRTQVYFDNENSWTDVYADVETVSAVAFLTDVDALQVDDSDWYMADIPVNFGETDYEITFHDGTGNAAEAAPLTADSDRYLTMTADETYSTRNQAEAWMNTASEDFLTVYYYNSEGWSVSDMYAYNWSTSGDFNEILGSWPGTPVEQDPDSSEWVTVDIPVDLTAIPDGEEFNLIFNDQSAEVQTGNILLENATDVYLAYNGNAYADKASAEAAMASTEVTFYNTGGWTTVYADAETTEETLLTDAEATQDGDTDWWTVEVPTSLSMNDITLTFHNGSDSQVAVSLTDGDNLIINMDGISDYETRALNELYYDQDTSGYTDVYFYNTGGWSDVNAYAWDSNDNKPFGGWPGSPVFTDDTDADWLYIGADWDLDADTYNIIFNGNDGDVQTTDITIPNSTDVYITPYGTVHDSKAAAETEVDNRASTELHFYNSESWSTVNAYSWDEPGDELLGGWPGTALTDGDSDLWYTVDVPRDAWLHTFYLIYNDGNDQTENITIDNTDDVYLILSGTTDNDGNYVVELYSSQTDAETAMTQ